MTHSSEQNPSNMKTEDFMSDFRVQEPLFINDKSDYNYQRKSERNLSNGKESGSAIILDRDDISILNEIMNANQLEDQNVVTLNSSKAQPISTARNSELGLKE